jgi:hypothetical protein
VRPTREAPPPPGGPARLDSGLQKRLVAGPQWPLIRDAEALAGSTAVVATAADEATVAMRSRGLRRCKKSPTVRRGRSTREITGGDRQKSTSLRVANMRGGIRTVSCLLLANDAPGLSAPCNQRDWNVANCHVVCFCLDISRASPFGRVGRLSKKTLYARAGVEQFFDKRSRASAILPKPYRSETCERLECSREWEHGCIRGARCHHPGFALQPDFQIPLRSPICYRFWQNPLASVST